MQRNKMALVELKETVPVLRGMINRQVRVLQPEQYPLQIIRTERELVVQAENDLVCHASHPSPIACSPSGAIGSEQVLAAILSGGHGRAHEIRELSTGWK
jgi:hypothetical protein